MSEEKREGEEKKYPCVFSLKDDCDARRLVEESQTPQMESSSEEKSALEKVMGAATKGLEFDDKKTAEEIGRAVASGMSPFLERMIQGTKPTAAMMLRDYCSMCPMLHKENASHYLPNPFARLPSRSEPGASESEKKE
jgi:hypothetical protein